MNQPQIPKIGVMTLFLKSLKSPYTRKSYAVELERFRKYASVETPDELLTMPQELIINYIMKMEELGKSYGSRQIALSAIKHFYEINDVTMNWKKISRFMGEAKKTVEDRGYSVEEIRRLLEKCDERKRVVLLTLASTGMRLGGLEGIRLKDMTKTASGIYKITVYAGTKSKYTTFCSYECTLAIDSYLDYRKRFGERITPDSPLLRNQFDKTNQKDAENVRKITGHMIHMIVYDLLHDSGIRAYPLESDGYKRKEVMAVHGFRKFFSTQLNGAYDNQNPLLVEMLLGHDTGLVGVYTKPSDEAKESFYLGGMDALTINEENRLKKQVQARDERIKFLQDDIMQRLVNVEKGVKG